MPAYVATPVVQTVVQNASAPSLYTAQPSSPQRLLRGPTHPSSRTGENMPYRSCPIHSSKTLMTELVGASDIIPSFSPISLRMLTTVQWALKRMSAFERHPSVTEQAVSNTWKISLALFINSACVVLLVNLPNSYSVSARNC